MENGRYVGVVLGCGVHALNAVRKFPVVASSEISSSMEVHRCIYCLDCLSHKTTGKFGMWVGNQQFTVRNVTVNNAQSGIFSVWNWGTGTP